MTKVIYLILFLITPLINIAQRTGAGINRHVYENYTYTTKDGLSQVSVNDIVQDNEGFLWVATQNGLNRFNGTSFQTYNNAGYRQKICGSYINVLLPDEDKIWIGTRAKGLCYFNKKKHRFFSSTKWQDYNNIEDLARDGFHNLFVTIENEGVGVLRTESTVENSRIAVLKYFSNKNITASALFITPTGTIWVGTLQGRLFYGKTKNNPAEIVFHEYFLKHKIGRILVLNEGKDNNLWVGTRGGLFRIDLSTHTQTYVDFQSSKNNSSIIYDLIWKGDDLWIATGGGLYVYNTNTQLLINKFIHSENNSSSISNNVVYSLFADQYNQIWAGTGKYLNLFYKNRVFNKIQNDDHTKGSLSSNVIFSILKNNHDLWVGTSGGGINLLRNNRCYTFTRKSHRLPSDICFSFIKNRHSIWAGTKEGLVIINNCEGNYRQMQVKSILHKPDNAASLSSNFIRYLYKDSENNIWLCTSGGGLNRFTGYADNNSMQFEHYQHHRNQSNSIASDKVNAILETAKNVYWLATDKGLSVMTFDKDNLQKTRFSRLKVNDSTLLNKEVIYALLKDLNNGIWIGTTGGLYYWNQNQLHFYNTKNGLPDNVIYAILEDRQHNIWVATNKGLSRFNKQAESFTNYHQSDGLCSEEYDLHASFMDADGMLYFGGIDGITYFNPDNLKNQEPAGHLYIDNVQLTNSAKNSIETIYPDNNQPLTIKQKQFPVSINFSNINLNYYKSTNFAYRLLPGNTRWNTIKNRRYIQIINLSPDNYTLEIREIGKNKTLPNKNLLRIPISVVPVWWQSQWAYWLYLVILILVIFGIFRFLLKRKLEHRENLRLKELDDLKSRLYANITHEFRTPLTVIRGMTNEMRESLSPTEQKRCDNKLEMIERNSDKLLHLVKQMLDMSKIEDGKMRVHLIQDNIVSYLQYVLESFQSMADAKNIKLVFYCETKNILMDYDQDKVFKIASNLLTNAIKFTPDFGKVIFHIKKETGEHHENLVIKVQDSGIGMEEHQLAHIFDRFYQVDNSHTRSGEGTGIGLALVKELVQLLHGTISVNSTFKKGTEFCVVLPILNKAPLQKAQQLDIETIKGDEQSLNSLPDSEQKKGLPLALVVEDNLDVAKYIISCIKNKYNIKWAPDGQKGIDEAIATIPDIIISDVMMPVKDGFEVCETLKQDERTSHIPIVLLTAKATDKDRIEGLSHGADAYLTKPFNKKELFVRLKQLIKIRRQLQEKYSKAAISITGKSQLTGEERFLKKVIEVVEKNLDNPELNAGMLAESLNMSESQLYRKLKALGRKSTALFIRTVRLSSARKMLETGEQNISEIAYACGFNDPAWFSRVFKKEFGVAPSSFRKG